jgi:nitrogen regulatory protein P-II 1
MERGTRTTVPLPSDRPRAYATASPSPGRPMQLLVAVINHAELVDGVLAGFKELGIPGATVLESRGMARLLTRDVPAFVGAPAVRNGTRTENRTVFCVVDEADVEAAIRMIESIIGTLETPGAGIAFTLPIDRVVGLRPGQA